MHAANPVAVAATFVCAFFVVVFGAGTIVGIADGDGTKTVVFRFVVFLAAASTMAYAATIAWS